MLSVEQALDRILADVPLLEAEPVALAEAYGRVLAYDLAAPRDVPPWDNSAMDGYAVRAEDTRDGEVELRLNEMIAAGRVGTARVESGTASGIMTGAPMPDGADAVVMVEHTDGAREGVVRIRGKARPRQHVRPRGDDVGAGDRVLQAGEVLGPAAVGLIASLGLSTVEVRRRPVVAILSTGDEVVQPGQPLKIGQIYSSNNHTLVGLVREAGAIAVDHGNAPDEPAALVEALRACLQGADAVITTGGVSVGAYDFVKESFAAVGAEMDFWKVRMKPGKPLAYGRAITEGRGVPLFGLPGNPVSCMVNFLQFVRPWLRQALGDPRPFLPVIDAIAGGDIADRPGRARLLRVRLTRGEGGWIAHSTGNQSSGVLTSMVRADGLLLLAPDEEGPQAGDRVRVQVFSTRFLDGEAPGYGW